MKVIKFKKLHDLAVLPKMQKKGDAAFDLSCVSDFTIEPNTSLMVPTGLQLASVEDIGPFKEKNSFMKIESRSGLALKHAVFAIGGIVDDEYRGPLNVILFNGGKESVSFKAGDRVAQLMIYVLHAWVSFELTEEVTETERGSGGFGSTGK